VIEYAQDFLANCSDEIRDFKDAATFVYFAIAQINQVSLV
jgi:hypothetical protein